METQPSILSDRMRGIEKTLIRRIHDLAGPDCIDLGLGELRFPTPRPILDHVRENLGKWKLGYTPNEGYQELRRRRDLAAKCLDDHTDLSYIKPEGTFYVFVDVADKKPEFGGSLDIAMGLLTKEKVVTIPGVAFGPRGEGYLRLSFAAEPEQIEEGIRRLGRFLA